MPAYAVDRTWKEELVTDEITVQVLTVRGHAVVAVSGEIDMSTASAVRGAIDAVIRSGTRQLIVDLEEVRFMDSSGLNTLIGVLTQLGPGSLRVVATQQRIRRVLSISGIDQMIPVFDSVASAIEAAGETIAPD
jgi:anti-sigma B factor antagonist